VLLSFSACQARGSSVLGSWTEGLVSHIVHWPLEALGREST